MLISQEVSVILCNFEMFLLLGKKKSNMLAFGFLGFELLNFRFWQNYKIIQKVWTLLRIIYSIQEKTCFTFSEFKEMLLIGTLFIYFKFSC